MAEPGVVVAVSTSWLLLVAVVAVKVVARWKVRAAVVRVDTCAPMAAYAFCWAVSVSLRCWMSDLGRSSKAINWLMMSEVLIPLINPVPVVMVPMFDSAAMAGGGGASGRRHSAGGGARYDAPSAPSFPYIDQIRGPK